MFKKTTKSLSFVFLLVFSLNLFALNASALSVNASGAVLIEQGSGRVLYSKDENKRLPMASTTKIMTAIVAIENLDLNDTFIVPKEASGVEGSSIYLEVGEEISVENLLYGLMLKSGNDAAVALAIKTAGSVEKFCDLMNQKARQLGAINTNFKNPNGLPDEEHYTTAYDLALIARYGMSNETFAKIVSTKTKNIPWYNHQWDRALKNGNKFLFEYDGANGIKTGFTKAAGRCLVGGAFRDNMQLITVVLNAPDMYGDTKNMMDYGFSNYKNFIAIKKDQVFGEIKVEGGQNKTIELISKEDIFVPVKKEEMSSVRADIFAEENLVAPIYEGQRIAESKIYIGDELIYQADILSNKTIDKADFAYYFNKAMNNWLERAS